MYNKIKVLFERFFSKRHPSTQNISAEIKTDITDEDILFYQVYSSLDTKVEEIIDENTNIKAYEERKEEQSFPENPLKPYWKPYSEYPSTEKALIESFEKQGRPFTPKDYEIVFNKHISLKNFVNQEKSKYLKKIWLDAKYIDDVFEPLRKLDIKYTLDLTGGSVRDFVLNKHEKIKDLDFMLSLQGSYYYSDNLESLEKKNIFTKEQLDAVDWNWKILKNQPEQLKAKLVELCFIAKKSNIKVFNHAEKRIHVVAKSEYNHDILRQDRLISVIKVEAPEMNYPVDILLTDFLKPKFIEDFDFDICKASMCFVNPHVRKEFPKDYSHLVSRFVAELEFWADVHNNTYTYDTRDRTVYQIERSFMNHFPRIKEKYPNGRIILASEGANREFAEKMVFADELSQSLSKVDEVKTITPPKRLKI